MDFTSYPRDIGLEMTHNKNLSPMQPILIGVIEWNKDFKIQSWSPEAEKIFGFNENEVLGKQPYEFIIPEDLRYHVDTIWSKLIQGESSNYSIIESLTKDGRTLICSWTSLPIKQKDGSISGVQSIVQDITENRKHDAIINRLNDALIIINAINKELLVATNERDLFQKICNILTRLKGVSFAWVGLKQSDYTILPVAWSGIEKKDLAPILLRWDESEKGNGLIGTAIRERGFAISHDLLHDTKIASYRKLIKKRILKSALAVPLLCNQEVMGAIVIFSDIKDYFSDEIVALLCDAAKEVTLAVTSLRLGSELQATNYKLNVIKQSLQSIIDTILIITEIRDPYTGGHERGVTKIATAIAQKLGWSIDRIEGLKIMCYLHDVGKIAVPIEILSKPGKLSAEEFSIIKTHAQVGHDILKNIYFPWPVADVVLQHHERMDGSGYPRGLKGEEILFETRILSVCDVIDAICNHRPYRPALGIDKALLEIITHKGTLYDPDVVDACIQLYTEKAYPFDMPDK